MVRSLSSPQRSNLNFRIHSPELPDSLAGARVLASGELGQLPLYVMVSDKGHGFVALEKYANIGYGQSITTVDNTGKVVASRSLEQLFAEEERSALPHTVSSIRWYEGAWIDEDAAEVIVFGSGKVFAASFLADEVRIAGEAEIIRGLEHGGERGAQLALELLCERRLESLAPVYEQLYSPLHLKATRLRAGLALARLGDSRAAALFKNTILPQPTGPQPEEADQAYALENCGFVMGVSALPILREGMRGKAGSRWRAATRGFVHLGERALPTLIEMLREESESNDYRGGAAHALRDIRSPHALEALLETVGDKESYVANAALNAAIAIDEERVAPELARWLTAETTQLNRLLMYFEKHRHADALPALRIVLQRNKDEAFRERIEKAIAHQMPR